jgi:hypothetical protein
VLDRLAQAVGATIHVEPSRVRQPEAPVEQPGPSKG